MESETFETSTTSGDKTTRIFTGSKATCLSQRSVESSFGASTLKVESVGDGNYRLTAGYTWDTTRGGNSQLPVNSHELDFTMEQVDVYNSDVMRAQLLTQFGSQAGVNGALTFLQGAVVSYEKTAQNAAAITAAEAVITTTYSGAQQTLMLNLFRGIAYHKVKNSTQFNTTYKRRITAASFNQVQAGFVGAGQIWTTAEVISFENVPSSWWFQLPTNVQWLKVKPQVLTVANQKTEISYHYMACYEAWSGIYTAYGAATLLTF